MTSTTSTTSRGAWGAGGAATPRQRVLLGLAVLLQLVVLYAPRAPSTGEVPGLDKVVHATVFGLVAFAALRCGLSWVLVACVLVGHAVVSELVQHWLLPGRSGDVLDAVADVAGVGLGLVAAVALAARRRRRPAEEVLRV